MESGSKTTETKSTEKGTIPPAEPPQSEGPLARVVPPQRQPATLDIGVLAANPHASLMFGRRESDGFIVNCEMNLSCMDDVVSTGYTLYSSLIAGIPAIELSELKLLVRQIWLWKASWARTMVLGGKADYGVSFPSSLELPAPFMNLTWLTAAHKCPVNGITYLPKPPEKTEGTSKEWVFDPSVIRKGIAWTRQVSPYMMTRPLPAASDDVTSPIWHVATDTTTVGRRSVRVSLTEATTADALLGMVYGKIFTSGTPSFHECHLLVTGPVYYQNYVMEYVSGYLKRP